MPQNAFGTGGQVFRPDPRRQRSRLIQQLLSGGTDTSPVQHPVQGLARGAQSIIGALLQRAEEQRFDKRQKATTDTLSEALQAAAGRPAGPVQDPGVGGPARGLAATSAQGLEADLSRAIPILGGNPETARLAFQLLGQQQTQANKAPALTKDAGGFQRFASGERFGERAFPGAVQKSKLLTPEEFEQKKELRAAGSTNVNVDASGNKLPDPPKDFVWARNEDGTILLSKDPETGFLTPVAVPIQGGPAARGLEEDEKAAAKREASKVGAAAQTAETMLAAIDGARKELDNPSTPAVGTFSRPFALISSTPAGRLRAFVATLQSGVVLGAMMRLKAASSQGATGFGAMNEKELQILIDSLGKLDPNNTEPDIFLATLDRIEALQKRVIKDIIRNVTPENIRKYGVEELLGITQPAGGANPAGSGFTVEVISE